MKRKILFATVLATTFISSFACTKITNNFGDLGVFTARTMDLCVDLPYDIAIYPRNMDDNGNTNIGRSLQWKSKYASAMIREVKPPLLANVDGMNEKGLVVNLLYLDATKYPKRNSQIPGIDLFKWAKYVLDNYATVSQVLNGLNNYQITYAPITLGHTTMVMPLHFSISDSSGDNAIIEIINGKYKIYHGKQYNVLTNDPDYSSQLANLTKVQKTSNYSLNSLPGGADPAHRFVRASFYNSHLPQSPSSALDATQSMFSAISGVFVPYHADYVKNCGLTGGSSKEDVWPTQWASVFDQKHLILYLLDGKSGNQVSVDLNKFNLKQKQSILILNPQYIKNDTDFTKLFTPESNHI